MKWLDTLVMKHKPSAGAQAAGESELYFNETGQLCKRSSGAEIVIEGGGSSIVTATSTVTEVQSTATLTASTTPTTPTGLSTNIYVSDPAQVFEVNVELDAEASSTIWTFNLAVDGTNNAKGAVVNFNGRQPVVRTWRITGLSVGNHTIAPRVARTSGTSLSVYTGSSMIINAISGIGAGQSSILRLSEGTSGAIPANTWGQFSGLALNSSRGTGITHASGVITVTNPGWYRIGAQFMANTAAFRTLLRVVFNSTNPDTNIVIAEEGTTAGGSVAALNGYAVIFLNANSTLRLYGYTTTASTFSNVIVTVESADPAPGSSIDTGWSGFPANGGWSNYGGGWNTAQYKREGNKVFLRGLLLRSGSNAEALSIIGVLPLGFRPQSSNQAIFCYANVSGVGEAPTKLNVYPNGDVQISRKVDTGGYHWLDGYFFID